MFWIHTSLTQWKIIHKKINSYSQRTCVPPPQKFFSHELSLFHELSDKSLSPSSCVTFLIWARSHLFPRRTIGMLAPFRQSSILLRMSWMTSNVSLLTTEYTIRTPSAHRRTSSRAPQSSLYNQTYTHNVCTNVTNKRTKNTNTQYTYTKYIHNAVGSEADWK